MGLSLATEKEYREKLQPLAQQIREMADKANDPQQTWSSDDEKRWTDINAEYDKTKSQAERLSRAEAVQKDLDARANAEPPPGREDYNGKGQSERGRREEQRAAPTVEDHALATQAWFRAQSGLELKKRHVEACKKLSFNPRRSALDLAIGSNYRQIRSQCAGASRQLPAGRQERAQSINLDTAGGYLRPEGFINNLEIALLAYADVREYADVLRTDTGNDLPWPTVNDTSNKGHLIAENTQVQETDLAMGQIVFHAYKFSTDLVLIPAELMEDSAINLAEVLGELFGIRLGRAQADYFTFGTGAGQPTGFITGGTLGWTTASATAIAADELYDLKHSVDPWYRPGATWVFHDQIYKYIKQLKDGQGRYLWQSGFAADAPDTIDGDPIRVNQSMANSIAAGNITVAYGQFSKFKIRDVARVRMRRLVERYADYDQEGFIGFMRCDSNLLDAGTHPIKYLQQA